MYGTTRNEAFHRQLKSYFRNVMRQTRRNAQVVCEIATLGKAIAGKMDKAEVIHDLEEHDLLRFALSVWLTKAEAVELSVLTGVGG